MLAATELEDVWGIGRRLGEQLRAAGLSNALDVARLDPAMVRHMRLGGTGNYIGYQLFCDSSRRLVWGNTVGTDTAAGTGTGTAQSQTVYGRVAGSQNVPASSYSDTVIVIITCQAAP